MRVGQVGTAFFLTSLLAVLHLAAQEAGGLPPSGALPGPQAHVLMKELGGSLVVLDVRTHEEYAKGHVPGAIHIPVDELEKRVGELPTDSPILILCRSGRRAAAAYDILLKASPGTTSAGLWHLDAKPVYKRGGKVSFK